ncbi:MAG: gliding motility-associated C-terminal domain-containing protein [Bacteroidetes bacterium]|nr:gliding motility-associated C-terminal domain-containing protein [Bacteroidota bacterium]
MRLYSGTILFTLLLIGGVFTTGFTQITVSTVITQQPTCADPTGGEVTVTVSGGVDPYTVNINGITNPLYNESIAGTPGQTIFFLPDVSHAPLGEGAYVINAFDQNLDIDAEIIILTISQPVVTVPGAPVDICENDAADDISLRVGAVPGGGTFTFSGSGVTGNFFNPSGLSGLITINVQYDLFSCSVTETFDYNVNPEANPALAGPNNVCEGSTGNVYTTDPGQTNYIWAVSAGGTITAGGGATDNTATVTWNTAGAQTVTVNYTDASNCSATSPTVYNVTVNNLPTPTITGPVNPCIGSTGNLYSTEAGQANYVWTVSAGGVVTSGGGATDNTVTVTWNTAGAQTVSVNYTDSNLCTAVIPTIYNVTVQNLPVPTISGPSQACLGLTGNIYSTEGGQTNYLWTVSAGGTITSGGGATDNTVTVTWTVTGAQTVSVNYEDANGCTATSPTVYNVTVNNLPVPTLAGPNDVCESSTGNVYTTEPGQTNYVWLVSAGGTVTSGGSATDNTVTVTWNTAGAQTVSVNYEDGNGCTAVAATVYNVTVNSLPVPTLGGPNSVCEGTTGNVYATEAGQTNYVWAVSAGGVVTSGGGAADNTVTVTWTTAGAQTVSVNYEDGNSCTAITPIVLNVSVDAAPIVSTQPTDQSGCEGGNASFSVVATGTGITYQWEEDNGGGFTPMAGETGATLNLTGLLVSMDGFVYRVVVSGPNCPSVTSNTVNLTVDTAPVVTVDPVNQAICEGDNVTFTVTATGDNRTYQWQESTDGGVIFNDLAGETSASLTLNSVSATMDANRYRVVVGGTNCPSVNSASALLTVVSASITGDNLICLATSSTGAYQAPAGQSNYVWTVSGGGTIDSGQGTDAIVVTWSNEAIESVGITYTTTLACDVSTSINVNVFNTTPAPVVSTPQDICQGDAQPVLTIDNFSGQTVTWYLDPGLTTVAGSGEFYTPSSAELDTSVPGSTSFFVTQTIPGCGEGPAAEIVINVNSLPDAGLDAAVDACNTQTSLDLFSQLGGTPTAGGTWSDDDISGALTGSVFDPAMAGAGTYNFTYLVTSPGCPDDMSTVTVTVENQPDPGIDNNTIACVLTTSLDLFMVLGGTPDTGGTWTDDDNSGALAGSIFDPSAAGFGTYKFSYSFTGLTICTDTSATVTIDVENVSPPPVVVTPVDICINDPAPTLTATGTSITWYSDSLLTNQVGSGNTYTPASTELDTSVPGATSFYTTQDPGCGPSGAAIVVVNVLNSSPVPIVVPVSDLCRNDPRPTFEAIGTDIMWHSDMAKTDTIGIGNLFTPNSSQLDTDIEGTTFFYASQNTGCGRSDAIETSVTVIFNCLGPCFTSNIVQQPSTCNDGDGSITFTLDGNEILPVQFRLLQLNGTDTVFNLLQSGNFFDSLFAGTYQYVINDSQSCDDQGEIVLMQKLSTVDVTFDNASDINCSGENAGIVLTVTRGMDPYEYSIDEGTSWQTLVNNMIQLTSGTFVIWVRDDGNDSCPFKSSPVEVTEPDPLSYAVEILKSFPDLPTGSILISDVGGGIPGFEIRAELIQSTSGFPGQTFFLDWTEVPFISETGKFEINIEKLFAGIYQVDLRDSNRCEVSVLNESLDPEVPLDDSLFIPNVFTPNKDGYNDFFFIRNMPEDFPTSVLIVNRWGKKVFESANYNNEWMAEGLADGVYYYTINIKGETKQGWVEVWRGTR